MGLHTTHEARALRWAELCSDSTLHDLTYKIELNVKTRADLGAGAIEVRIVDDAGALTVPDATGPQPASRCGGRLTLYQPAAR